MGAKTRNPKVRFHTGPAFIQLELRRVSEQHPPQMRAQSDGPAKGTMTADWAVAAAQSAFSFQGVEINRGQKKRRPGTWRDGLEVKVYKK